MSDNDLSYDDAMRLAKLRAIHQTDQMVAAIRGFVTGAGLAVGMLADGIAFMRQLDLGMRSLRSDVRIRAMLATREDFDRQYAKQRANKRRRDKRR